MGTSRSGAQLAAKFERAGKVVLQGNDRKVKRGAEMVRTSVLALAAPRTGGDLAFSGAGNKRMNVRTKVLSTGANAKAVAKATGPMHWLEGGVKPHPIVPKKVGGSRAARSAFVANAFGSGLQSLQFGRGRGVLAFAGAGRGDGFTKYARRAGGLPAYGVWSKGVDAASTLYGKDAAVQTVRELSSVF